MAVLTIVAKVISMAMITQYRRKHNTANDYLTPLRVSYVSMAPTPAKGQPVGHCARARVHRG